MSKQPVIEEWQAHLIDAARLDVNQISESFDVPIHEVWDCLHWVAEIAKDVPEERHAKIQNFEASG